MTNTSLRSLRYFSHALGPRRKLGHGVEIVVALVGGNRFVIGKPGVVAPPVQPYVANRGSGFRGGFERSPDDGLINVAESRVRFCKHRKGFRCLPRSVPHFDDQRVIREAFQKRGEMSDGFRRAVKRKRELQQHSAEFSRGAQHVEPGANRTLVFGNRGFARRSCAARNKLVCEALPQLCGKDKARIRRDAVNPLRRVIRPNGIVERRVDLDGVKKFGEIRRFVKALRLSRRVNVARPNPDKTSRPVPRESQRLRQVFSVGGMM